MKAKIKMVIAILASVSLMGCGNETSIEEATRYSSQNTEAQTAEIQTTENETETIETSVEIKTTDADETTAEATTTTEEETTTEEDTSETEEVTSADETSEEETTVETTTEEETTEPVTEEPTAPVEITTVVPVETDPVETTPVETTPAPTTPVETTPEPTTPEETTVAPVETTPTVTLIGITASVNGDFYIGDTLTAANFSVVGNYSDGHTENLNGWAAAPLNLSAATNTITVTYQDYSTTVTVNAAEKPVEQTQPAVSDNLGTAYHPDDMFEYIAKEFYEKWYLTGEPSNSSYGKPYVCSTFVQAVFAHFGMSIPSDLNALYNLDKTSSNVIEVPFSEAKPGDILVYVGQMPIYGSNGEITGYATGHTGIYYKKDNWGGIACMDLGGDQMYVNLSHFDTKYKVLRFSGNIYANTNQHTDRWGLICDHIECHTNLVMIAATLGNDFIKNMWDIDYAGGKESLNKDFGDDFYCFNF